MTQQLLPESPTLANGIPLPVEVPPESGALEKAESTAFGDGQKLDHRLRSAAGYGALIFALALYLSGMGAIALFLGLFPTYPAAKPDMWHIVVATLVALFSVPTVLLLSVLRSTGIARNSAESDSMHSAIGEKVMQLFDKLVDK